MLIYNFFLFFIIILSLSKMIFNWNIDYDEVNDQFILHYTIWKKRKCVVLLQIK